MHRPRLVAAAALAACALAACSGGSGTGASAGRTATPTRPAASSTSVAVSPSTARPSTAATTPRTSSVPSTPTRTSPVATSGNSATQAHRSSPQADTSRSLPLSGATGDTDQAITVVASSRSRITATLQAWTRVPGGWEKHGTAVTAHVGSGGIGKASEGSTRTPAGSFTVTQAFGHDNDPGTRLPYVHTTPADWWISQSSSPLYNTRQRCSSSCSFTRGDPNEHLYYETPYYDYAAVIDYNTANAPGGVTPGAGSAFFLHVTDGGPTAGCVSIAQSRLVSLLRWLRPAAHPRIIIGVA